MWNKSYMAIIRRGPGRMLITAVAALVLSACGGDGEGTASSASAIDDTSGLQNDETCVLSNERVAQLASTIQSGESGL